MSRTDAHVPVWVRVSRQDLPAGPWHARAHDACDLPPEPISGPQRPETSCYWLFLGDADHRVCACELCYGHADRRRDVRRERRRTRQRLEAGRRRGGLGLDGMSGPHRRRDWWT